MHAVAKCFSFYYLAAVQVCCPEIDDKSFIAAYPGYLARVELLVNWGNCTASIVLHSCKYIR